MSNINMLDPLTMALHSRHLIEASAGTGKTFNITRIYLRLLLEKKLSVQQILVMTFTKAATEEIKARVASFIREVEAEWDKEDASDFTQRMRQRIDPDEGRALLMSAMLSLDEASIFTIHGFCQRVLKQFAVALNTEVEPELLTDTAELTLQATQDWMRSLRNNSDALVTLSAKHWHNPEAFHAEFRNVIQSDEALTLMTPQQCIEDNIATMESYVSELPLQHIVDELFAQEAVIFDAVVNGRKDSDKRGNEWAITKAWLEELVAFQQERQQKQNHTHTQTQETVLDEQSAQALHRVFTEKLTLPPEIGQFVNGTRFKGKDEAKLATEPLRNFRKNLNEQAKKWAVELENKQAQLVLLKVVESGIYAIRKKVEESKLAHKVMSFDDLIRQFSSVVSDNTQLVAAVKAQFPVALVDEFQDTDAYQYQIFDALYPKADISSLLVMIGDPKQAIYGFRGGDIFVYLEAKQQADFTWFMDTNWRSSANMVEAYNRVFWGHDLSQSGPREVFGFDIHYEKIESTHQAKAAESPLSDPLEDADQRAAINYLIHGAHNTEESAEEGADKPKVDELLKDLVNASSQEVARLLTQARIGSRDVKPADIAILVRDGFEAEIVQDSLIAQGLASVYLSQKTPLFESKEAVAVYRVLNAIANFDNRSALIAGLTSSLLLNGVEKKIRSDDTTERPMATTDTSTVLESLLSDPEHPHWDSAYFLCLEYQQQWQQRGVFDLLVTLIKQNYESQTRAERSITNLMHIAESLAGVAALNRSMEQQLTWLSHQIANASTEEALQLRLESDANLIKIVTLHGSKGLEYPIVFVPFANKYRDPTTRKKQKLLHFRYQDMQANKAVYQFGSDSIALQKLKEQEHAETIRLLYVAITRAEYRCYLGMVDDSKYQYSSLNLALGVDIYDTEDATLLSWLQTNVIQGNEQTQALMVVSDGGNISTESDSGQPSNIASLSSASPSGATTQVALPELSLAPRYPWLLSSFSNMARFQQSGSHENYDLARPNELSLHALEQPNEHNKSELAELSHDAEFADDASVIDLDNRVSDSSLRFTLKKGADTGNLLHDILENVDFVEPNWEEAGAAPLAKYPNLDDEERLQLFAWLQECLDTPIHGAMSMSDLERGSTLREAEFYFPMAELSLSKVSALLNSYRKSRCERFDVPYSPVSMEDIPALSGMMHGFIDLIFECEGQYFVADYKSTHLGDKISDYSERACHMNNQAHLYDLQYLIYALALHKYLSENLADYQFERDFGGVKYLYLRGMINTDAALINGVFSDKLEKHWLDSLAALFDGESPKNEVLSSKKIAKRGEGYA